MLTVAVHNETNTATIGDRILHARTSLTRLIGLLGRCSLEAGEGLWISPSSGVHTLGMRFAIDVVGLDKNLRVVRLWSRVQPYRFTMLSTRVKSVLELPDGQIARHSIRIGDQLRFSHQTSPDEVEQPDGEHKRCSNTS